MALVRASTVLLRADLLTDITSLGSDPPGSLTSDMIAWVDDQNNWYYPNVISAGTSTWTAYAPSAATPTWEAVLTAGNTSGVNDAVMSLGRALRGIDTAAGSGGTLTARGGDDSSTGTGGAGIFRAGDSDSGTAGALIVRAGNITTTGAGGAATVSGGASVGNFDGGDLNLNGGVGGGANKGGDVFVTAGAAGVTSALNPAGGGVTITGGASTAAGGVAGAVLIRGGVPVDGDGGGAIINGRDGVGTNRQGGAVLMGTGGGTGSGNGGLFQLTTGDGGPTGSGGNLAMTAGNSGITSGNGGDAFLTAGDGADSGGEVFITAGTSSGGGVGRTNIQLAVGAAPGSTPTDADEILRLNNAGTNGGTSDVYLTDRTPVGFIFANPGSLAIRESAATSALYVHNGAVADNSSWVSTAGAATWAATLTAGQLSGGLDPIISATDTLRGTDSGVAAGGVLNARGGSTTAVGLLNGGDVNVTGGSTSSTNAGGHGGHTTIAGGPAIAVSGGAFGGSLFLRGGTAAPNGKGGSVTIQASSSGTANSDGGDVTVRAGNALTGGFGGFVDIFGGNSLGGSTTGGRVTLNGGEGSTSSSGVGGRIDLIGGPGPRSGGALFIKGGDKTLDASGTNFETGAILIETGDYLGGGGGNTWIGNVTIRAKSALTTDRVARAGSVLIEASHAGIINAIPGGDVTLNSGNAYGGGGAGSRGGDFTVSAGSSNGVSGDRGGNVTLTAGNVVSGSKFAGNVSLQPGTGGLGGKLILNYSTYPAAEGASGQFLSTDGAGALSWATQVAGPLTGSPGNVYENLQFYVDPADRNSFPATGGVVATDLEGNGTAGTLSAAAVFDNGAWTFTGSAGEKVQFTKGATLDNIFTGGGTILTLIRPYSDGASSGRVIDTDDGSGTAGYLIYMAEESGGRLNIAFGRNWSTQDGLWVTDNVTDAFGDSGPLLQAGDWGVLALSYNDAAIGNDPTFYWNGTPVAFTEDLDPQGSALTDAGEDIFIGNRLDGLRAFDGQIGTVLMFDRILTAQEVQQVSDVFAARRGIGIRGYDSPGTAFPISGQTIELRAGDSDSTDASADPGNIVLQAGNQTNASGGPAGEIIIRSGDQTTGTSFGTGSRVLIESGKSSTAGGVTLQVGVQDTGNTPDQLLIAGGNNTGSGFPSGVLIRGGGAGASGRIGGPVLVRGGDGGDHTSPFSAPGGNATFRGGDGTGFGANGGICTVRGGNGGGGGDGGKLVLEGGTPGTNNAGGIEITAQDGGSFGFGGSITVTCGSSPVGGSNEPGGSFDCFTGSTASGNFTGLHGGDFTITTGGNTFATAQPDAGGGSFIFTGGSSNASVTTSPGGEFTVLCGEGVANSVNSRGGAVSLTGGAVTGGSAATAGGVTLTGGAATVGTGGTISLQPGTGTVADGGLILDYSLYPAADGTAGFILSTDGAGVLSWIAAGAGGSATAGQEGILYNGNTFYVDAGDRNSYPGTGTEFTDLINSTLGTMTGIGVIGGHFNFDGGTDVINFGVVVAAETEDIFDGGGTISFWVRPKSDGGTNVGRIIDTTGGTSTNGYFLRVDSESGTTVHLTLQAGHATTAGVWTVNAALQVGQWSHVVVTYNDDATTNDPTFYVNTLIDPVDTETTPVGVYGSDTGNTLFMGNSTATTEGWDGDIDVAIFLDRAISTDEVQQLYRVQQSRFRPSLLGPRLSSGLTNAVGTDIEISGADGVGSGEGADVNIAPGDADTTGSGGDFALLCGTGGSVSGAGGLILMVAGGAGNAAGSAGTALFQGGAGSIATVAGGAATIQGGTGNTTGFGGTATVQGGTAGSNGIGGSVQVFAANGGASAGAGGTTQIESGDGVASGANGGSINIITGASVDATGATSQFVAGTTNAGIGGGLILQASDGTTGGGVMTIRSGSATVSGNPGNILLEPGTGFDDEGYVDIAPDWTGDASHYLQFSATGTNTDNATQMFTGNRDPNSAVTGEPGSLYMRGNGTSSTLYVNSGATVGTTWTEVGSGTTSPWSQETATTTDATVGVTIATPISPVADGTQHSVEVLITAESGGANTYFRRQVFTYYRDGGGAVQWTQEINGAEARRGLAVTVTASLSVSGNDVLVTATGQAATSINWKIQYRTTNTITNGGTVNVGSVVRETFDNRSAPVTTGSASASGGTVDFTISAGAAYVTLQFLRVVTATGTCADATVQFFRDAGRTDEIYDAQNKDPSTQYTDRVPATMMGNDGSGLASNTMYGRITNNDAGAATFDVEAVLWGVA